jgi:denticleless
MLLVSSIDSCHYLYSLSALDQPPVATLTGHRTDSFCVKSFFSPCGQHVLSGSSDRRAYIWDVSCLASLRPFSHPKHLAEHGTAYFQQ